MCMDKKQGKSPNHRFIESWAMGMNDYEIARQIGVDLNTLRRVKDDLTKKK